MFFKKAKQLFLFVSFIFILPSFKLQKNQANMKFYGKTYIVIANCEGKYKMRKSKYFSNYKLLPYLWP